MSSVFAVIKLCNDITTLFVGADIDKKNWQGRTALKMATQESHGNVVSSLVKLGANVNLRDKDGYSALDLAAKFGLEEVALTLLKNGADVKIGDVSIGIAWSPLMFAACYDKGNLVLILLDHGAEVNEKKAYERTAIHISASKGRSQVVTLLLNNEEEIDVRDDRGQTALIVAALQDNDEVVMILLENGADVSLLNKKNFSALMISAKLGHGKTVTTLLDHGAQDIPSNSSNPNQWSSLMLAAKNGHADVVTILLNSGADINRRIRVVVFNIGQFYRITKLLITAHNFFFFIKLNLVRMETYFSENRSYVILWDMDIFQHLAELKFVFSYFETYCSKNVESWRPLQENALWHYNNRIMYNKLELILSSEDISIIKNGIWTKIVYLPLQWQGWNDFPDVCCL